MRRYILVGVQYLEPAAFFQDHHPVVPPVKTHDQRVERLAVAQTDAVVKDNATAAKKRRAPDPADQVVYGAIGSNNKELVVLVT